MKPILIISSQDLKIISHGLEYLLQNYVKIIRVLIQIRQCFDIKFVRHVLCKKALCGEA